MPGFSTAAAPPFSRSMAATCCSVLMRFCGMRSTAWNLRRDQVIRFRACLSRDVSHLNSIVLGFLPAEASLNIVMDVLSCWCLTRLCGIRCGMKLAAASQPRVAAVGQPSGTRGYSRLTAPDNMRAIAGPKLFTSLNIRLACCRDVYSIGMLAPLPRCPRSLGKCSLGASPV